MAQQLGSSDRIEHSNYLMAGVSRSEAITTPEQQLEKSTTLEKQAAHSRSETVPSAVGDRSPNDAIKAMQGKNDSTNASVMAILGGVNMTGGEGGGSMGAPEKAEAGAGMPPIAGAEAKMTAGLGVDGKGAVDAKEAGRDNAVLLPNRNEILARPMSELKDLLSRNNQQLENIVTQNLAYLQDNRVAFHGTDQSGMDGLNNDKSAKGNGLICVATAQKPSSDASEWIDQNGRALQFASTYDHRAAGGGVAVFRLPAEPAEYIPPGGNYSDIDCLRRDKPGNAVVLSDGVDLACTTPFPDIPQPPDTPRRGAANFGGSYLAGRTAQLEAIGEIKMYLGKGNFDQKLVGWLDRDEWAGLSTTGTPDTADGIDRNNLAREFEKQGMVTALLNKLGVAVPLKDAPESNDSTQSAQPTESADPSFLQRVFRFFSPSTNPASNPAASQAAAAAGGDTISNA